MEIYYLAFGVSLHEYYKDKVELVLSYTIIQLNQFAIFELIDLITFEAINPLAIYEDYTLHTTFLHFIRWPFCAINIASGLAPGRPPIYWPLWNKSR